MKFLVAAAWEPELVRLRERVAREMPPGVQLVFEPLGVGLVEAAAAMTRCIMRHEPEVSLLIGTCGAFAGGPFAGGRLAAGAVVVGRRAAIVDASVVSGLAVLPPPMPAEAAFDPAIVEVLVSAGAKSVQIANTLGITVDDALAARLAGSGDVEHLEAFAFARACASASPPVPCAALLGVANMVGAAGRAEWLANHERASAAAADVAFDVLAAIAESVRVRTSTTAR